MASSAPRGFFVTGTGTEVGKTIVAAVLARSLASTGRSVAVFKPVETGLDESSASGAPPDHELLRLGAGSDQTDDEIAPYRFGPAVSPHLAAELAGEEIDPSRLVDAARAAAGSADVLVCEGVGGFLVPLTPTYLIRDFARELGLPVVIAAAPGLGTINHTLLTVEAIRAAELRVAAVVLTPWPESPSGIQQSNRLTVARLGAVRVETLPALKPVGGENWPALDLGM
ncbi:MAG: dethiobiotin synthetase [Solirubrobacterales bacterium]|jgi:dethiobiotin synthetase|nr:dethiobiotin synthetase [Solirubrobacterales bacterium]